jgi:large subunit ribosomal protein L9
MSSKIFIVHSIVRNLTSFIMMKRLCLMLVCLLVNSVMAAPSSFALKTASFVPPASPTITTSSPAPTLITQARRQAVARSYGTTQLWAKKKRAPAAAKKIQVKMTKHVAGTGSAGDVVLVTPAFFNNKLRPTQSAVIITDEEVAKEESEKQAQAQANNAAANKIKEQLEQEDFSLAISKKAGPDGQLFGAVSPKAILEELQKTVNDDYLSQKRVKVTGVTQDGTKHRGDIKHVGEYGVTLSLTKEISAKFPVKVQGES